jgi:aminopeptidase N
MRTGVLLALPDGSNRFIPVTLTASVTELTAAKGLPAPRIVFPNAGDYGYFVTLLDTATTRTLESGEIGRVSDGLLRSMLWGALWDNVRAARLDPARYARLVLKELSRESDEQIVPGLLGRLGRAIDAYLPETRSEAIRAEAEMVLWSQVVDSKRGYGIRRASLDAFIGIARTPDALQRLRGLLNADSAAGEPVRDPTRWNVVERLLVLGDPSAEPAFTTQAARDTTPDGRRRAFTVGAARWDAAVKADYFRRWFADQSLNEDWASGSLGAFNAIEHERLTLPWLRAALDSLPYIKANRRIFFLGSWLGAFIGGQTSAEALVIVKRFLADHPRLDADLRQKVLQNMDELERTVRIRKQLSTD